MLAVLFVLLDSFSKRSTIYGHMAIFLSGARIRYFNYLTYEKMNQEKPKERSA